MFPPDVELGRRRPSHNLKLVFVELVHDRAKCSHRWERQDLTTVEPNQEVFDHFPHTLVRPWIAPIDRYRESRWPQLRTCPFQHPTRNDPANEVMTRRANTGCAEHPGERVVHFGEIGPLAYPVRQRPRQPVRDPSRIFIRPDAYRKSV
jgi:hypothetical protein